MESFLDLKSVQFWCCVEVLILFGIILCPIIISNICKFGKNRLNVIYQRRYAFITIYEGIIYSTKLFVIIFVFLILSYLSMNKNNDNKGLSILLFILIFINNLFAFSLYLFQFWRFFLLHYEIKWSTAIKSQSWQHLINPKFKNKQLNFYINPENKKKYGNSKWMFYRIILPLIIIFTILFNIHLFIIQIYSNLDIMDIIWYDIGSIIFNSIIYGLPFILLYYLYHYKLPTIKFEDMFFVQYELKKILSFHLFNWIFYILYRIIIFILAMEYNGNLRENNSKIFILITAINLNLIFLMEFLTVYTSTNSVQKALRPFILNTISSSSYYKGYNNYGDRIPLMSMTSSSFPSYINNELSSQKKKAVKLKVGKFFNNNKNNKQIGRNAEERQMSINSNESDGGTESVELELKLNVNVNVNVNIKLGDILCNEKGFESFILHLSGEFSIENLLCLVELCQFQMFIYQYLLNNNIINEYDNDDTNKLLIFGTSIIWPLNVPKSIIVFGENEKDDEMDYDDDMQFYYICKIKAKKLFEKYINTSSEYEVNLSYSVRNKLLSLMRNESLWMLNNNKHRRTKKSRIEKMSLIDLMHIFDDVMAEVFQLMQDAFNRFKNTNQFDKVKNLIIKQ